jgi:hypothetical protein
LSKTPRRRFLTTCSVGLQNKSYFRIGPAFPDHSADFSFLLTQLFHSQHVSSLLLFKKRGCQHHPLPSLLDSRPQEERSQVLLDGARTDLQLGGNVFVTATLYEQSSTCWSRRVIFT